MPPSRAAPPIAPTTPPMMLFECDDRPELPPPELLPLRPAAPEAEAVADSAAMTLLVVWTLLKVLLPLTEITVVTTACVTLPVFFDEVVPESLDFEEASNVVDDLDSAELTGEDCVLVIVGSVADVDVVEGVVAPLVEDEVVVEAVVWASTDDVVDSTFGIVEVDDGVVEVVGVEEMADVVDEAAVPIGTSFCRYCRGRRASSIFKAIDKQAQRRRSTHVRAPERNILM